MVKSSSRYRWRPVWLAAFASLVAPAGCNAVLGIEELPRRPNGSAGASGNTAGGGAGISITDGGLADGGGNPAGGSIAVAGTGAAGSLGRGGNPGVAGARNTAAGAGGMSNPPGVGGISNAPGAGAAGAGNPTAGTAGAGNTSAGAGGVGNAGAGNTTAGGGGVGGGYQPRVSPSCVDMVAPGDECGGGDSCCTSPKVTGGTFPQGLTVTHQATVSDFRLDEYEVTVARFRKFVSAYTAWRATGNPATGAGAHPLIAGSGWNPAWNANLPLTAEAFSTTSELLCEGIYQTWQPRNGNELLPINCVNWFESLAFCIWDGGRLPTESEWEYAAAGGTPPAGSQVRTYPWGDLPLPSADLAVYGCLGNGNPDCVFKDILPVGSKPAGSGRYLQRDLAGSFYEWTLDWFAEYPAVAVRDYANLDAGPAATPTRVIRGGDFIADADALNTAHRDSQDPRLGAGFLGLRCARNAE